MNKDKSKTQKVLKEKNKRKINKNHQHNYLINSKFDEKYSNDNYKITTNTISNLKSKTLTGEYKNKMNYINITNIIKKIDLSSFTITSKDEKNKNFLENKKYSKPSIKNKQNLNYTVGNLINKRYKNKNKKNVITIKLSLNNITNIDNFNYTDNTSDISNIFSNRNTTNTNILYKQTKIDSSQNKKEDKHIKNLINNINKKINKKYDELDRINLKIKNIIKSKKNLYGNDNKFKLQNKVVKKISLKKGKSSINISNYNNTKNKKERKNRNKNNKSASIKKEIKHYALKMMNINLNSSQTIIKKNTKINSNQKLKKGNLINQIPKPTITDRNIIVNFNKNYNNNNYKNKKISLPKKINLENRRHFSSEIMKKNIKLPLLELDNKKSIEKNEICTQNYLIDNALINIREYTIPGKTIDGKTKINQDRFIIQRDINYIKNFNIFAIFDGHGFNGQIISEYLKENLVKKFTEHPKIKYLKNLSDIYAQLTNNRYQIINEIFQETDYEILNNEKILDANLSGSTCILLLQIGDNIICANLGDSKAILVYEDNNITQLAADKDIYKIVKLSRDCTPHIKTEKMRILMDGGIIKKLDNNSNNELETLKIFIKDENIPGLNITRSFGDKIGKSIGMLSKPFINEYILNKSVKYIVITSSGIWHLLKERELIEYGKEYYLMNDPDNFCKIIANKSAELCRNNAGNIDDITLIVLFFTFI